MKSTRSDLGQNDIFRLEVAMNNVEFVSCAQSLSKLDNDVDRKARLELTMFTQEAGERRPLTILKDHEERTIRGPSIIMKSNKVRMVDLTEGLRFLFEALGQLLVARITLVQNLDGNCLTEPDVAALIDRRHPPNSDAFLDPISASDGDADQGVDWLPIF